MIVVIWKNFDLLLRNMAHFHVKMQYILVFIKELNESVSELVWVIGELIVTQVQGDQMCTMSDRFNQLNDPFKSKLVPLDGELLNDVLRKELSEEGHWLVC